jgi:hypothetical protein
MVNWKTYVGGGSEVMVCVTVARVSEAAVMVGVM